MEMKAILLDKMGRGIELAKLLGIESASRAKNIPKDVDVVVRYGNREEIDRDDVIEINRLDSLAIIRDRRKLHEVLKANGVPNPYFKSLRWWTRFPVYVYDKRGSECGKGIVLVTSRSDIEELKRHGFEPAIFSKVLRVRYEFRVHVCRFTYECNDRRAYDVLMYMKVPNQVRHDMFVVRNISITGYKFERIYHDLFKSDSIGAKVCRVAIDAVRACGLDFAGVDVIMDEKGKAWVIDVNGSPGIVKDDSKQFYAHNLGKLLDELGCRCKDSCCIETKSL